MKFTITKGVNPEGECIPVEKRGVILPSTRVAQEERMRLASLSPRLAGKKLKKEEK